MDGAAAEGSLRRLYAPTLPTREAALELGGEAAQHARVLRLQVGDLLQVFDGRGSAVTARITRVGKAALACVAVDEHVFTERARRVVLVQCLPKAGKLDDIVRMTTELGVAEIALAVSEHCVAKAAREEQKLERLERIASEAARQSEQAYLPVLRAPRPLAEVLARAPEGAYRAALLERSEQPLPSVVSTQELWLVVGPEGGLSAADRELLSLAKFVPTALGRSILRTETAAVVGVALALERLGRG